MTQASNPHLHGDPFPTSGASQVALYGRDAMLLSYRNQVLCWAGFTTNVLTLPLMNPDATACAEVALLCHSLTEEDRRAIVSALEKQCPGSKILALTSSSQPLTDNLHYDALVESLSGPDALIKAVRRLLGATGLPLPASI